MEILWKRMERSRNSKAPAPVKDAWQQVNNLGPRLGKQAAKRAMLWMFVRDDGQWSPAVVAEVTKLVQKETHISKLS
eukprot:3530116-Alexandrium_andersonii.AAC.1